METEKIREFMELVGRLKHLKRTGWVLKDIQEPESIAGHMYRMAVLSMLVDDEDKIDKLKIIEMALIHDLAECIVGDITPVCGIPVEEKHRREEEAMVDICNLLGDKGPDILKLFHEYESQQSAEAKYVKDLDLLDFIMQAFEYEQRDSTLGKLEDFFVCSTHRIQHPKLKKMASEIVAKREDLLKLQNK